MADRVAWLDLDEVGGVNLGDTVPVEALAPSSPPEDPDVGALYLLGLVAGNLVLAGVLEGPQWDGARWTAEPNTVSVRSLDAAIPNLDLFAGDKVDLDARLTPTPRLSAEDRVVLRALAWPTPGSAYHAAVLASGGRPAEAKASSAGWAGRPEPIGVATPMPWPAALADVATWTGHSPDQRVTVLTDLCRALQSHLGDAFDVASVRGGVAGLGVLLHRPSGQHLVVVPGGTFAMGFTLDDILAVLLALDEDDLATLGIDGQPGMAFRHARPPRFVSVTPFLLAREPIDAGSLLAPAGLSDGDDPMAAIPLLGFRLPSEAEWEWIAREGGAVRFVGVDVSDHPLSPSVIPPTSGGPTGWGFAGLHDTEQAVADGWHPDYLGAPITSAPWDPQEGPGVSRMGHTWWQSTQEVSGLHAAQRFPGDGVPRLAMDLPPAAAPPDPDPDWGPTSRQTLAALLGSAEGPRHRALIALGCLSAAPGPDVPPLVEALLATLPTQTLPPKVIASVLRSLAGLAAVPGVADRLADDGMDWLKASLAWGAPAVRAAAVAVLVQVPGGTDAVRDRLGTEVDPLVLASMALALAADPPAEAASWRIHADPRVRGAAALGQAEAHGIEALPADGRMALVGAVGCPPDPDLPWFGGDLRHRTLDVVEAADAAIRADLAPALASALDPGSDAAPALALRILQGILPPHATLRDPDALTPPQRRTLVTTSTWAEAVAFPRGGLAALGIPPRLDDRRRWLGLDPPGFLETAIDQVSDHPGDRPFWRWLDDMRSTARAGVAEGTWPSDGWARALAFVADLDPLHKLMLLAEDQRHDLDRGLLSEVLPEAEDPAALIALAVDRDREGVASWAEADLRRRWALHEVGSVDLRTPVVLGALVASTGTLPAAYEALIPLSEAGEDLFAVVAEDRRGALLLGRLAPVIEEARTSSRWSIRLATWVPAIAAVLAHTPSAPLARGLLFLGAASGHPARTREVVATHAVGVPSIQAALDAFDAWPRVSRPADLGPMYAALVAPHWPR